MDSYTTQQTRGRIVQLSVFVSQEQKKKIEDEAKNQNRSISNFCKIIILKHLGENNATTIN